DFDPNGPAKGSQPLPIWLTSKLKPNVRCEFRTVDHPAGRVVLLEIAATTTVPVEFDGTAYIRIGSSTSSLSSHPGRHQHLIDSIRPYNWENAFALTFVTSDEVLSALDYASYFRLVDLPLPNGHAGILERLEAEKLIVRDVGRRWNVTNLGAILFAVDLRQFNDEISRKAIRFIAYEGRNRTTDVVDRQDGQRGYAAGFEGLMGYINALIPKRETIGQARRESRAMLPSIAIRELVANALIHQDMTITGAGPQVELFEDRLIITNPGLSLVEPERMIDAPPRSRNASLASLMRRMRLCEEQGSGLDKTVRAIEDYHLPPLRLRLENASTQAVVLGPRPFAKMTTEERVEACYQHAVLRYLDSERLHNRTLRERLGIGEANAAQATTVINRTRDEGRIKVADPEHPKAGYVPHWA
ncbi:MAG: ATP-binding protein, partial [Myxococcota bacterium]